MSKLRKAANKLEDVWDHTRIKVKQKLNLFDPVIIYPYRGYGNHKEAFVQGRILEKEARIHQEEMTEGSIWHNIRKVIDRYESDEMPGAGITGRFLDQEVHTSADEEGYFTLHFTYPENRELKNGWHQAELRITDMPYDLEFEETSTAEILINNQQQSFGIISDVDDTIIESHATNPLQKLKTMLQNNANTRTAFEGVEDLQGPGAGL